MATDASPLPAPERAASWTALACCAQRALHQIVDGEPRVLVDPIAARLVTPDAVEKAAARDAPRVRALRAHLVLRSRFAEDRLRAAVAERGVRTLVILGAGLDTFAYRQPDWAAGLRIVEVDHPASQRDKRARLAAAGVEPPSNLEFHAIDFATTSLADGLAPCRLPTDAPVFFFWLGVMMYLAPPAVDAVFSVLGSQPRASEVVFSFANADSGGLIAFADDGAAPAAPGDAELQAAAAGEPWLSVFDPDTLAARVRAHGFSDVSMLSVEDGAAYFALPRVDDLRPPQRVRIGAAVV